MYQLLWINTIKPALHLSSLYDNSTHTQNSFLNFVFVLAALSFSWKKWKEPHQHLVSVSGKLKHPEDTGVTLRLEIIFFKHHHPFILSEM